LTGLGLEQHDQTWKLALAGAGDCTTWDC